MVQSFITNKPSINMTMVGFGQAGSRMADEFAAFQTADGKPMYNCLALNSNDGDLKGLKHIPKDNRVSLELGGLGKNPEKAMGILEENKDVRNVLKTFIQKKVRPEDDLVLFFAGLGGGTGTSTIVKSIEEFYEFQNQPIIKEEIEKMKKSIDSTELKNNTQKYLREAMAKAQERFTKIGVVVTLPLRNDGPEVLRQVNGFAKKIWDTVNNPGKGIAFVLFADNQHFYDEFEKLSENEKHGIKNYRDYGNKQIADLFHELNTATTVGGSDVVLDSADFRRTIMEFTGSLVLSKQEVAIQKVINSDVLVDLFKKSFQKNNLHAPIQLVQQKDDVAISKKVHHIGFLSVLDGKEDFNGGSYLDKTTEYLHQELPISGAVFNGYINVKNDFKASAYTFYKTDGLPERLEKGLVEEFKEFMEKNKKFTQEKTMIQSIVHDTDDLPKINLDELGISDLFAEDTPIEEVDSTEDSSLDTDQLLAAAMNYID